MKFRKTAFRFIGEMLSPLDFLKQPIQEADSKLVLYIRDYFWNQKENLEPKSFKVETNASTKRTAVF